MRNHIDPNRAIRRGAAIVALCAAVCAGLRAGQAEDWPQFRGPDGQGHSPAKGIPSIWDEHRNIAWKTPIAGLGWSSPVVAGSLVWLTTAIEESGTLRAVALDAGSGEIVRQVDVFRKPDLERISHKNSHASPTPLVEGDRFTFISGPTARPVWIAPAKCFGRPCSSTTTATDRPARRCSGTTC